MDGGGYLGGFFKAADLVCTANLVVLIVCFLSVLTSRYGPAQGSFARNLCLGIATFAAGTALFLANLAWVYWFHEADPMQSLASPEVRVIYLALASLGSSMLITCYLSRLFEKEWWPMLGAWMLGYVAVVALLVVLDGPGLALATAIASVGLCGLVALRLGAFSGTVARFARLWPGRGEGPR